MQGAGEDPSNLRSLCGKCHKTRSSSQAGRASAAARRAMLAKRFRPRQDHPGLVRKEAP